MKRSPRSALTPAHTIPTLERAAALGALAALSVATGCDNPFSASRHGAHAVASSGGVLELATLFAAPIQTHASASPERATTRAVATAASVAKATPLAPPDPYGGMGFGGGMRSFGTTMPRHHGGYYAR